MSPPRTADELRRAWLDFFAARGHSIVPSASVIPVDRSVLFTVAGMVPFKPYFTGDEVPPYRRAASIQKCVRAGGKHNDLDDIGRTNRHFSFFEMLGNFSFGDYFKAEAIPWAWELTTEVLGFDPDRLWVTVHVTDDEAARIWTDVVGVAPSRVQRLDADNYWRMGDTGPCGPSSELFYDLGPEHGPDGGPAGGGEDRYIEFWNLVFMQYDQQPDGTQVPLPRPSIDTGAGLERILAILQGVDSIWDIDVFRALIAVAGDVTATAVGADPDDDVSLRILAEHARTMTFMVSDGVVPSNEERGYVLRRIIRRAVRHAYRLGAEHLVTPPLIEAVTEVMGDAYPDLVADRDVVLKVVSREEERFRSTLQRGLELLDGLLADGDISGEDAFFLHDTLGFPIDLTGEIASERGRGVDLDGFRARMAEQRARARAAHVDAGGADGAPLELFRELVDEHGPTTFTGRDEYVSSARVLALVQDGERIPHAGTGSDVDVVLDRTPFYAESGGQVGDTGELRTSDATVVRVDDTAFALPGVLTLHRAVVLEGELREGDEVVAAIDGTRRDDIRRNHTATHLLHWALREVLGTGVAQAGSLVAPDRLRFDFSHPEGLTREQLDEVEDLANAEVLTDAPVRHFETTMDDARTRGALAFFGEKYGDTVRVLEAGSHSLELCGGTHVDGLGFIGPIKITHEGSIGSNLRRIEAVTGRAALARIRDEESTLRSLADSLRATPGELVERVDRLRAELAELRDQLEAQRARESAAAARELAARAVDRALVVRHDGVGPKDLGRLAQDTLRALGSGVVGLVGSGPDGTKPALAVAVSDDLQAAGVSAAELAAPAARALGGGTAKHPGLVSGGGRDPAGVDDALERLREAVHAATA